MDDLWLCHRSDTPVILNVVDYVLDVILVLSNPIYLFIQRVKHLKDPSLVLILAVYELLIKLSLLLSVNLNDCLRLLHEFLIQK